MSRSPLAGALGLLALLAVPSVFAQSWSPVGPPGGDVRSLAVDPRNPQRLYLGTADGVLYRSHDAGHRWERVLPGFPRRGHSMDEMIVDPRGRLVVAHWDVAGSGGGVAVSTDGGDTFTVQKGIEGQSVRALAIAGANPDVMVVGAISGVFRSRDGGAHWERITPEGHAELRNVESVAIDPRNPDVLYVGTWHLPWKTADGGRTWNAIHTGMIDDSDVFTMTLDRRDPNRVFATACSGIYRSTDAAARWARIRGIPSSSRRTRAFAQDVVRPDTFYAGTTEGLWASADATVTWSLLTPKNLVVNAVVPLPDGSVLLGTEGAGVLRSTDAGKTWTASNEGFSERFVRRIVFDRAGSRVLVGIWGDRKHGGVLAAASPRGPWTRLGAGLEGREVLSLAAHAGTIAAGTDDGVFVLEANGAWKRLPTVIDRMEVSPRVHDLAVMPPGTLLAGTSRGLLRSTDGGLRWTRAAGPVGEVTAVGTTTDAPGLALAATALGFYRSGDGGTTWTQVSSGLGDAEAHSLAFLPRKPRVVYASARNGVYRSQDQGRTWARLSGGLPFSDMTGLAVHPDGRTMYASDFTWGGVYRSTDAGETWTRLPASGLVTDRVWAVGIDPASPERVLAASPAGGLHLFVDQPLPPPAAGSSGSP